MEPVTHKDPFHAHHQTPRPPILRQSRPDQHPGQRAARHGPAQHRLQRPDFVEVYDEAFAGVKRVLRTDRHLFMYNASGHGAWETSLTNLLSPGDAILVLETGFFSDQWGEMAIGHGLTVRTLEADRRMGLDLAALRAALAAEPGGDSMGESGGL